MRIIAGSARGLKLKAPRGEAVRPTTDKVKEALFNILGPRVIGALAADLFAGSGALGIEALSRGADSCVFVENNHFHAEIIRDNLKRAGLSACSRFLGMSASAALKLLSGENLQFDLIFIDPPYHSALIPQTLDLLARLHLLKDGGLAVVEHPARSAPWTELYLAGKQKKYGSVQLSFIHREALLTAASAKKRLTDRFDDL